VAPDEHCEILCPDLERAEALRSEGLVMSRRDGKMVMYSLTERGRELLAVALAGEKVT
jgi:hypothetical protein